MMHCSTTHIFKFRERSLPQLHVLEDKLIAKTMEPSNLVPAVSTLSTKGFLHEIDMTAGISIKPGTQDGYCSHITHEHPMWSDEVAAEENEEEGFHHADLDRNLRLSLWALVLRKDNRVVEKNVALLLQKIHGNPHPRCDWPRKLSGLDSLCLLVAKKQNCHAEQTSLASP